MAQVSEAARHQPVGADCMKAQGFAVLAGLVRAAVPKRRRQRKDGEQVSMTRAAYRRMMRSKDGEAE